MLISGKKLLDTAQTGRYCVGAFNFADMEVFQAIVDAAKKENSPVICQTSEGAIKYAGLEYLYAMGRVGSKQCNMALHLDHGRDLDIVKQCIKIGYSSVMYDGSHLDFEENIRITKKVVGWAHKKGVSVEAELGTIGGAEDKIVSREIIVTDPVDAVQFVEKTGCDSLAIAIGTSHGAYKFAGKSKLDIKRLKEIDRVVDVPLVLHGASSVPQSIVRKAEKYGAKLGNPHGVRESELRKAVKGGINKINTDTDLRLCFDASVREILTKKPKEFDPRHILGPARSEITKLIRGKMRLFGSSGKI